MAEFDKFSKIASSKAPWEAIQKLSPEEMTRFSSYLTRSSEGSYIRVLFFTIIIFFAHDLWFNLEVIKGRGG